MTSSTAPNPQESLFTSLQVLGLAMHFAKLPRQAEYSS